MSRSEIIRIPILPFNMVNAHLIKSSAGCILVNTSIPGSARKIGRSLNRHGLSFKDIKLIVVTHAHTDHAGSAACLRQLSGAPILAHKDEADFYSRKQPMTFCPTGRVGRLFLKLQRMVQGGAKRFHMGHGGPLAAAEVIRHVRSFSNINQSPPTACHCAHPAH